MACWRLQLLGRAQVGRRVSVEGRLWVHGGGRICLGDRVRLEAGAAPIELHALRRGEIAIGPDAVIGGGTSIEAVQAVSIGAGARLGAFCKVLDNHFHAVGGDRSRPQGSSPVVIGDGAVVGDRAILLPGARVAAGQVVPPGAVLRGKPGATRGAPGETRPGEDSHLEPPHPLRRVLAVLRARLLLRGCELGRRVYAFGPVRVGGTGRIRLGDHVGFAEGMIATELRCQAGATLEVGEETVFGYGVTVEAHRSIRIGRRCMLASGVLVRDDGAADGAGRPTIIGDDVWIAHGAEVGPGVHVGDRSVVAAGSLVARDVPSGMLAIGRPARCIGLELLAPRARQGA
jgi:maltose O-acetyltransferase